MVCILIIYIYIYIYITLYNILSIISYYIPHVLSPLLACEDCVETSHSRDYFHVLRNCPIGNHSVCYMCHFQNLKVSLLGDSPKFPECPLCMGQSDTYIMNSLDVEEFTRIFSNKRREIRDHSARFKKAIGTELFRI
jgi:hypothetical protein